MEEGLCIGIQERLKHYHKLATQNNRNLLALIYGGWESEI